MRPLVWALPLTVVLTVATCALAGDGAAVDETTALFASAARALHEGRAGDAISSLETLADLGVVDPVASYDRGLAYALRVRIGAEVPGDLGRAAHGFEEARERSRDPRLIEDASRAVGVVRSEIARRRARAAQPVEVDPGRSLARTVSGLLAEDTWSAMAAASSAVLAIALFVRWLARVRRMRIAGGVAAGIAAWVLFVATAMTMAARHDRTRVREAVVVAANARPVDDRGITVPGAAPLPEGARVEVIGARGPWGHVRFGNIEAWVASNALRDLARAE
ncbi:MAG: hypothetical protein M3O46_03760 [Myxococcota bacterium]|nr:hypothetical protein [Myxococcota bacterium]